MIRIPGGHGVRSSNPVGSTTSPPTRASPSVSIAGANAVAYTSAATSPSFARGWLTDDMPTTATGITMSTQGAAAIKAIIALHPRRWDSRLIPEPAEVARCQQGRARHRLGCQAPRTLARPWWVRTSASRCYSHPDMGSLEHRYVLRVMQPSAVTPPAGPDLEASRSRSMRVWAEKRQSDLTHEMSAPTCYE